MSEFVVVYDNTPNQLSGGEKKYAQVGFAPYNPVTVYDGLRTQYDNSSNVYNPEPDRDTSHIIGTNPKPPTPKPPSPGPGPDPTPKPTPPSP